MKSAWADFLSPSLDFRAKRFLIVAGACLGFVLLTARPVRAQQATTSPVYGTAGFETGLQPLANNTRRPYATSGDPTGVMVNWGDGQIGEGLVQEASGVFSVYGTHLYEQTGTYPVQVVVNYCFNITCIGGTGFQTLNTSATIYPPGKFVILSIGDSIASGEGNPNQPNNLGTLGANIPTWSFWNDGYSTYEPFSFPLDEQKEWPRQAFPCHRSSYAGPAQAANRLEAMNPGSDITFIHYACSGAAIEPGDTEAYWVQDAVGQLKIARERLAQSNPSASIGVLLISAGSNSMYGPTTFGNGFGGLVSYCLHVGQKSPTHCDVDDAMQTELAQSLSEFPTYYKNLAMEINCQQPPPFTGANGVKYQDPDPGCTNPQAQIPKLVLITEYMDPTHDQNGKYPASLFQCPKLFYNLDYEPDGGDFNFFYTQVVEPLNDDVDNFPAFAQAAGLNVPTYAVTGIGGSYFDQGGDDFLAHGVCAGPQRWVNNDTDSENLLGVGPPPNGTYPNQKQAFGLLDSEELNGLLHPNSAAFAWTLVDPFNPGDTPACPPICGHEDYMNHILESAELFNPPVTTASATAGGSAYTSGTWTFVPVEFSLSATNAINNQVGQPNVGYTYYAVDNAACGSSFATQYPANVPGCRLYTGPFTISSNGKHTVTFFSVNSSGYPIDNPGTLLCPSDLACATPPSVPPLEGVLQSVQVWIDHNLPIAASPALQYLKGGEAATFNLTLGHYGWPADAVVNLTCQTSVPEATCSVVPNSVSLDSSTTAVFNVYTTASGAIPASPLAPAALRLRLAFATALLLVALAMRRRRWSRPGSFAALAISCGLLFAGCSAGHRGTPGGIFSTTVTGVSGNSSNTAIVTIIVK